MDLLEITPHLDGTVVWRAVEYLFKIFPVADSLFLFIARWWSIFAPLVMDSALYFGASGVHNSFNFHLVYIFEHIEIRKPIFCLNAHESSGVWVFSVVGGACMNGGRGTPYPLFVRVNLFTSFPSLISI
jgi:hypothetical protein